MTKAETVKASLPRERKAEEIKQGQKKRWSMSLDLNALGEGVVKTLEAEADKRGHTISALIRHILRSAVRDGLKGVS